MLTFRSQLPEEMLKGALPFLAAHLRAEAYVGKDNSAFHCITNNVIWIVHTYSASAIDKLLILKKPGTNEALVSSEELAPLAEPLLSGN